MRKFQNLETLKEEIRQSVDLVDFIGGYISLQKRGERFVGLCPFHQDVNNPRFTVSPGAVYEPNGSKGVWGCFTCEARGDLFGFVQRMHDASFIEAIHIIAEKINFDLVSHYRELSIAERLREERYAVMDSVADLFHDQLLQSEALGFYTLRGIDEETLRTFKIGYCPSLDFLTANIDREVLDFMEPDFSYRPRLFGGHLLYPQWTAQGRIWGFSARQPDDRAKDVPKYVGSSKLCKLYDPAGRLYGFHLARRRLRDAQLPLTIVEGYHDALAAYQAGFAAVATCGTNLSSDQIETLVSHAVHRATVVWDPDDAGQRGMLDLATRAHKIHGLDLQFASIAPEPEEFIRDFGADAFRDQLQEALGAVDFIIAQHADENVSTPSRKRDFLERVRGYLLPYPRRSLNRALGIAAISKITSLAEEVVADYLDEHSDSPLINLPGELIILAEFCENPSSWIHFSDISENDFSLAKFRQTFAIMRRLYEREGVVNIDLLATYAANGKATQEVLETIAKLPIVQRNNPEFFMKDVRDKSIRRNALEYSDSMRRTVGDLQTPVSETLANLIQGITDSMTVGRKTSFSSREAVDMTITEISRACAKESGIAGLDLGPDWAWITMMINGLQQKSLMCIAAFLGVGKSLVGINWVHKLSIAEEFPSGPAPRAWGAIFSMEMTPPENVMRLAAIDSGVSHFMISHGRFDAKQQADMAQESLARIGAAPLTWYEGTRTMRDISMQARLLQARGKLDYLVIDYIQLLDLGCYNDRWSTHDKFAAASWDIKELSNSLSVPIITIAQLNRKSTEEDIPTLAHMGDCIDIGRDTHSAFILVPRETGLLGSLDKNRSGGKGAVSLVYDADPATSNLRVRESKVHKSR